jgi:hypothetical protein
MVTIGRETFTEEIMGSKLNYDGVVSFEDFDSSG